MVCVCSCAPPRPLHIPLPLHSLSLSQIPSFHVPRADEEWVELLRDMNVERSGAVDRAAWCAYLSALGSQGETQMGDLIAELQMVRCEARRQMEAAHS